jgi:alanine racemase
VVPVTKGNGYGFGNRTLAAESTVIGVATLAVGTYEEMPHVFDTFAGDILVLTPWRPWQTGSVDDDRVIHTVSRVDDLHRLAVRGRHPRVVVELMTSMRRHGIEVTELPDVAKLLEAVRFEGCAMHLPLAGDHHQAAAAPLVEQALDAIHEYTDRRTIWLSHVTPAQGAAIGGPATTDVRLRVATAMWLGDRTSLRARATVLDVHQVRRGQSYGYRQRRAWRHGTILVIAGGTAHGISLEAPTPATTARQRVVAVAQGGLDAMGKALSPFRVSGKRRWFAEPPHMQCSMIWLPGDVKPPAIGDEVDVDVRFTTTAFDHIVWEGKQ